MILSSWPVPLMLRPIPTLLLPNCAALFPLKHEHPSPLGLWNPQTEIDSLSSRYALRSA